MIFDKKIIQECRKLPYSKSDSLTKDIYKSTGLKIEKMWDKYGFAKVLASLSSVWSQEKAIAFFSIYRKWVQKKRSPQTIATLYNRGYNGGVERVNAELMTLWTEMGYNVVFFSREKENPLDYPYPDSIKRVVLPIPQISDRLKHLETYCLKEHVDLMVYHDWTNPYFVWECILLKLLNISVVLYCNGHFSWCFSYGKSAIYQLESYKFCDLIVSLSETNARFYQLSGYDSFVVNNPIPGNLKNVYIKTDRKQNHILYIGRIATEKYPLEALQIFKKVHDSCKNTVLDIVGDGDETLINDMRRYISEKNLSNSVIFHGIKTADEIADFYRSCGCMLFTSKMEGYPMVVLEAKAYGVPMIMYEMPYLSLTKDKLGIITAPVGNIVRMADNLIKYLKDKNLQKQMEEDARKSFNNFLSINQKEIWEKIFTISCGYKEIDDFAFYKADKLSEADKYILPVLFDKIKIGYDSSIQGNLNYRVGKKLLKFPRFIKKIFRTIKEKWSIS